MHDFTPRRVLLALVAVCSLVGAAGATAMSSPEHFRRPRTSPQRRAISIASWTGTRSATSGSPMSGLDEALLPSRTTRSPDGSIRSGRSSSSFRVRRWSSAARTSIRRTTTGSTRAPRQRSGHRDPRPWARRRHQHVRRAVLALPQRRAMISTSSARRKPRLRRSPDRSGRDPRPAAGRSSLQ